MALKLILNNYDCITELPKKKSVCNYGGVISTESYMEMGDIILADDFFCKRTGNIDGYCTIDNIMKYTELGLLYGFDKVKILVELQIIKNTEQRFYHLCVVVKSKKGNDRVIDVSNGKIIISDIENYSGGRNYDNKKSSYDCYAVEYILSDDIIEELVKNSKSGNVVEYKILCYKIGNALFEINSGLVVFLNKMTTSRLNDFVCHWFYQTEFTMGLKMRILGCPRIIM